MEMPLFPLNTVLFPSMPLRLHIFEDRYKEMINNCIETKSPFGVVLIESGDEALGPLATPHSVGTTAHITQVQKLPFGRMNILALGRERFRVREVFNTKSYLSADVEMLPMTNTVATPTSQQRKLRPLVQRYLGTLEDAGKLELEDNDIPHDPTALAYLAAILLQAENTQKQTLLESEDTSSLIDRLTGMYKREVALLDVMLSPPPAEKTNHTPFSLN